MTGIDAGAVISPARSAHLLGAGHRSREPGLAQWQLVGLALIGSAAAAAVGYVVAQNPHAAPSHVAVGLRVALIATLMATGIFCLTGRGHTRMGLILVAAGLYACVWLLNGASDRVAFSVGVLVSGVAPVVFSYLILAYPTGSLRSPLERRFLVVAGGALLLLWTIFVLTPGHVFETPLLPARPRDDLFSALSLGPAATTALQAGILLSWTAIIVATPILLFRAVGTIAGPLRRSWVPFELVALANAVCWVAFLAARAAGSELTGTFGALYVAVALAVPLAILIRLWLDRVLMGRALAAFLEQLVDNPQADPQALMAGALQDPSLLIAYPKPHLGGYVDASGALVALPQHDASRAIAWIEPVRGPSTAVVYDARLANQAAFVHAAGAAAAIHLEVAQLEADLRDSTQQLAASRLRLLEAADAERQRIERDLHDSVQQQIVGLRLKLDLASEAIKLDPVRGERMLALLGRDLDELLTALRTLAKGIYPSVLKERGVRAALASAALHVPVPLSLSASGIGRYEQEIEVAVYFSCIEALQNVVKHGGPGVKVSLRLWQRDRWLYFEVRDTGAGFEATSIPAGIGLINMRDRMEAVGGRLWVTSEPGRGTTVRGRAPVLDTSSG